LLQGTGESRPQHAIFLYYRFRESEERWLVAKIESLHGTTPAEIFESGLENAGEIVAVATAVLWKDGRVTTGWSNVDPANLARMILVLDEKQRRDTIHDADLEP
jgi:hypothetical protein